jgi:hypothetical protein
MGTDAQYPASQSMPSRPGKTLVRDEQGMPALDETLQGSTDALLRKKRNGRPIPAMHSTQDPAGLLSYSALSYTLGDSHFAAVSACEERCSSIETWSREMGRLSTWLMLCNGVGDDQDGDEDSPSDEPDRGAEPHLGMP